MPVPRYQETSEETQRGAHARRGSGGGPMKARQPRLMCTLSCARHVQLLGEASRNHPVGCDDELPC